MKTKSVLFLAFLYFFVINSVFASANSAVILMYHRFGEDKLPSTNIQTQQFVLQLDYLKNNAYQVWALPQLVKALKNRQQIPNKVVVITVDDAYASVYKVAYPLLKSRNLPFTVFVSTKAIDDEYSNYMSWSQIRELAQNGVTIANHSRSHLHMTEKLPKESTADWLQRVRDEVNYAAIRIKQETGVNTEFFAYPYGEFSLPLSDEIKKMGYVGFGQQSGPVSSASDMRFLSRFPISEHFADMNELKLKLSSKTMPIVSIEPLETEVTYAKPVLKVQLSFSPENKNELSCYVSGQGKAFVVWKNDSTFNVTPPKELVNRRSRYNCTLKDPVSGNYYWYSHLWIKPEVPEE